MANLLLVDDTDSLRRAYSSFLTAEGHVVATASTVAEALEYLANNTPDLLLIDMLMPKVNGIQLLQQYDIVNTHKTVKAIAFSNLTEPMIEQQARDLGVSLYISKALATPEELSAGIAGVLAQSESTA
jgi:chemosensory pili system protein ChpA (sensor histidine kinase/response regulator)